MTSEAVEAEKTNLCKYLDKIIFNHAETIFKMHFITLGLQRTTKYGLRNMCVCRNFGGLQKKETCCDFTQNFSNMCVFKEKLKGNSFLIEQEGVS